MVLIHRQYGLAQRNCFYKIMWRSKYANLEKNTLKFKTHLSYWDMVESQTVSQTQLWWEWDPSLRCAKTLFLFLISAAITTKVSRDSNNFFSRLEKEIIKKVPESLFKSTDSDVLSLGKLLIIFSQLIINTRLVDSYLANSILVFSSLSISSSSRRYTHPVCNLTPEPIFINQPHTRLCFARSCRIHFWYFPHLNCSVEFFTLRRSSQSNS